MSEATGLKLAPIDFKEKAQGQKVKLLEAQGLKLVILRVRLVVIVSAVLFPWIVDLLDLSWGVVALIMVESDKLPKDKGIEGGSSELKLDLALHTRNKLGFVDGTCVRDENDALRQSQWDRCNSVVLSWILGCISQDLYKGQVFSKSAKIVWDELEETYNKQDGSVIFNLHFKIHSYTQAGSPLSEYYHNLNALWRQFDSLVNLPTCTCVGASALKEHNQLLRLMQFLMGLDEVFAPVRSQILTTDLLPDVKSAFATLSRDESHRNSYVNNTGTKTRPFAFAIKPNEWTANKFNNQNKKFNRSSLVCKHCNRTGHTIDRCFKIVGYPSNFKKRGVDTQNVSSNAAVSGHKVDQRPGSSNGNTHTFIDDQFQKLISLISDKSGAGSVPANIAGMNCVVSFCTSRFFNFNTKISTYSLYIGWIVDSGASQHRTYTTVHMFNVVNVTKLNMSVGHPNGTNALVTHIGCLKLSETITLSDVLVVPDYHVSLLSVHKLSKDNKLRVVFNGSKCLIQDSVLKTLVGTGSEHSGLYFFDTGKKLVNNNIKTCNLSRCIWHNRLGHPSDQVLGVLKQDIDIDNIKESDPCEVCHKAKQTRESFPLSEHQTTDIDQIVHLDVWGPYRFDKSIKVFRSDNGTEFVNQNLSVFFNENGIVHQTSCSYTPQQNGVAERKHRHLLNVSRALMFQGGIPLNMWTECVLTSVYLINRLPSSVLSQKSPYELIYKVKPKLSQLKTFGCLCFSTVLNNSDKFSSRSEKCVFLGYSFDKKGYKLFSLDNRKMLISRDVKFYETVFSFKNKNENKDFELENQNVNSLNFFNTWEEENKSDEPYDEERVRKSEISKGNDHSSLGGTENTDDPKKDEGRHPGVTKAVASDEEIDAILDEKSYESEGDDLYEGFDNLFNENVEKSQSFSPDNHRGQPRRSSRKASMPVKFSDFKVDTKVKYNIDKYVNYSKLSSENYSFSTNINKLSEPKSFAKACADPRWVEAMNLEMEALNRNGTWVVTELPSGRKAIGCKWVWKIKYKSNGEVERFKARLVTKGFNQKEGVDFNETFSPVVKIVTVRCMLAISVQNNWPIFQLDINNAFLYGDLVEDVYMKLPEGYFDNNDNRVSLLVYVDDIVVIGNDINEINAVKEFLKTKFLIKDLGKLKYFLGIEVLESKTRLCLTQRKYCLELLSEFGMLGCKPCNTPIEVKEGVTKKGGKPVVDIPLTEITNYQKLVGKLIYLTHTRPDISYVVHVLSQYMHAPMQSHLKLAFRVLRYLKGAPGIGVTFNKSNDLKLDVFVDSDWAKCKATKRSVTGYTVFLGNSLVSWKSKKQSMLSKSSAEAEYRAMNTVTCEVMWIMKILTEFGIINSLPVNINYDNTSAIQIAANPVFHERTKHFKKETFFLREKVVARIVKTVKIKSEDNIADLFTKGTKGEIIGSSRTEAGDT
ncbi:putative RNA-directed DNA polymerase [Tanacetum coccineum]